MSAVPRRPQRSILRDGKGAFHDFQSTGDDRFAGKNILSMALEIPNDMLGTGPKIGVWVTVSVRRNGKLARVDREDAVLTVPPDLLDHGRHRPAH